MKKIISVLLVLCCLTLSIAPALATEKSDLTDGEVLALHKQFSKVFEIGTTQKAGRRICLPEENSRPTRRRVVRCRLSSISLPPFPSRCDPSRK